MPCANESPPTAREQNAWQDGAFRFEHALQSRAYHLDRAEQTRSAHSSPRAQEYAQNARGHRGHDSSQALGQVISPTVSPRASIFESRSQTTRVGALERKNFFQSKSQWTFCAVGTLKKSTAPPTYALRGVRVLNLEYIRFKRWLSDKRPSACVKPPRMSICAISGAAC